MSWLNYKNVSFVFLLNLFLKTYYLLQNQEVAGYTHKCTLSNSWLYSERCIELVKSYAQQFPDLFDNLSQSVGRDVFFESDLFPNDIGYVIFLSLISSTASDCLFVINSKVTV